MKTPVALVALFAVLVLGVLAGVSLSPWLAWWEGGASDDAAAVDAEVLYWVAPMDASFRRDAPGKSPMGMDLVPVYARDEGGGSGDSLGVHIDPAVTNNLGVRVAVAERGVLHEHIRTVGRLAWNTELTAHVHLRSSGWVEQLVVRAEGERVSRGDLLMEVYAPELVNAQSEFLQALRSGRTALVAAGRERLRALGIADAQIVAIERSGQPTQRVQVFAPQDGIVTALEVAEGQYVQPGTDMVTIVDPSVVWLLTDVFAADAAVVEAGAWVGATTSALPGERLKGVVSYIYPELDPVTRTLRVRTVLPNPDGRLRAGTLVNVVIDVSERAPAVLIPVDALIRTGNGERVVVAVEGGHFRPAAVRSGREAGGRVEILAGLDPGERVVVSGQFLIDSESSLAGADLRMLPGDAP